LGGLYALSAITPRATRTLSTLLWGNRYNHGPKNNLKIREFENLKMEKKCGNERM